MGTISMLSSEDISHRHPSDNSTATAVANGTNNSLISSSSSSSLTSNPPSLSSSESVRPNGLSRTLSTTPEPGQKQTKPKIQRIWVIIGPAGSGKSTVSQKVRTDLDLPFLEGDDVCPCTNCFFFFFFLVKTVLISYLFLI